MYRPISIRPGETLGDAVFFVRNPDGSPCDLTGCTAKMTVRVFPGDTTAVLDLSTAASTLVINGPSGTVVPSITPSVTASLTPGVYGYDVMLTQTSGQQSSIGSGPFFVIASNVRS